RPRAGPVSGGWLFGAAHQLDPRFGSLHQAAIGGEIVERHAARGEARLELLADRVPAQIRQAIDGCDRAGLVLDDEAGEAVVDDLGDRAAIVGDDGRAARHRLDHHEAERLRPIDWDEQPDRAAQKSRFLVVADFSDVLDQRAVVDQRTYEFIVIILVGAVDLGGDLQRYAAAGCDLDRAGDAVFRR